MSQSMMPIRYNEVTVAIAQNGGGGVVAVVTDTNWTGTGIGRKELRVMAALLAEATEQVDQALGRTEPTRVTSRATTHGRPTGLL